MKCLLAASGPSLNQEDIDYARYKVDLAIAINDAIYLMPWADILYSGDNRWWNHHGPQLMNFSGERLCAGRNNEYSTMVPGIGGVGPFEKDHVRFGGNSGFAAINLALHRGASSLYLLGYDLGVTEKDQATHFFGEHPKGLQIDSPYEKWIQAFEVAAPSLSSFGARVYNCTPNSNLNCFPKVKIQEVLTD